MLSNILQCLWEHGRRLGCSPRCAGWCREVRAALRRLRAAHSAAQGAGRGCCRPGLLQAAAPLLWGCKIPGAGSAAVHWHLGALCAIGGVTPASLVSAGLTSTELPRSPLQLALLCVSWPPSLVLMFSFTRMSRLFLPFKAWHLRGPSGYSLGNVGIARTYCTISFKQKQIQKTSMDSVGLL